MHPEDIKASLRKVGSSPADISRAKNVSKMAVSHVIHGNSKSERLAREIARVTGIPVAQIWPGKYPVLEFVERAGLASSITARQAEADLAKTLPHKPKAPAKRVGKATA